MNPVCELLGIRYPILLGGMLYAGRAQLAAAVSAAGGLGILGAGRMQPRELIEEIETLRRLTPKPFGINIPLRAPYPEALINAALTAEVNIFALSGGSPAAYAQRIKTSGAKLIQVVASVHQALKAQAAGADAVVAEGGESGGMVSKDLVTTLALVPQVVDAVHVPVIAAGGLADGRGMAAVFALGARGIQMGTRFLACTECDIPAEYKQALIIAGDTDTWVLRNAAGTGRRTLKKELLQRTAAVDIAPCRPPDSGMGRGPFVDVAGDSMNRAHAAGQSAGLIREILPAGEIIRRIWAQANRVAAGLMDDLG